MALSTEQVIEIVSKITGLPHGLFIEQKPPRTKGGLTNFVLDCPAESDEYSILVNAKDELIEVKNAYNTWGQAMIAIALNPPPPLAQRPDTSNNTMTTGAFQSVPVVAAPPANMPPPLVNYTLFNAAPLIQYLVDYLILNPGCIIAEVGSPVNEASVHQVSAWEITNIEYDTNEATIYLNPSFCTDQNIVDNFSAALTYDPTTGAIIEVSL